MTQHIETSGSAVTWKVPLRERIKSLCILGFSCAILVAVESVADDFGGRFLLFVGIVGLIVAMAFQVLEIVRSSRLSVDDQSVSVRNALGTTRTYRFEHCGPFRAVPVGGKRDSEGRLPAQSVAFNYQGPERLPPLANLVLRSEQENAYIAAAFDLDAYELEALLNERRIRALL